MINIIVIYILGQVLITRDLIGTSFLTGQILRWILFLIVIFEPTNFSFKVLFSRYSTVESIEGENTVEGAGAMIGNMERLLIAILIYYNQFGAIGLVFTAKSVARFDKISNDTIFAEYYLIGSLYSIIAILITYGLIIN